ncbi:hypothetical protein G9A89_014352 [Geosiphon pyriformis]|nr:hypothetical protein G9A89_014352 [Geosiphon pyriformis]
MGDYALSTSSIETKKAIWRPLLSTIRCIQVPLIEVPSVLDLYMFDTVSLGGGSLCNGYKILDHDCIHKKRVREGDVKAITLVNEDANKNSNSKLAYVEYLGCSNRNGCHKTKCNWKGRIAVPHDKPLNLCNIVCYGNHDPDHI